MGNERLFKDLKAEIGEDYCCAAYSDCFDEAVKFCSNVEAPCAIFTGCVRDQLTAVTCFASMCVKIQRAICKRHQGKR